MTRFIRFTMKECSQGSNILSTLLEFWFVSVRHMFRHKFHLHPNQKRQARGQDHKQVRFFFTAVCVCVSCVMCQGQSLVPTFSTIYNTLQHTMHFPPHHTSPSRSSCDSSGIFFIFFLAQSNCSAVSIPISADATCTTLIRMPNAMARNCSNFSAISNAAGLV
jgi:hypothetical protein